MQFVETRSNNGIFEIILNRPDKRNALNSEFVQELIDAFALANEDEKTRVVLLKANGKAFSAGADLAYLQQLQNNTYAENLVDSSQLKSLFSHIYNHQKIVIAQVEGHAIAGGCGLATVCDFVFAVPDALFGYTEVKIGFVPAIVMFFLLRKIGEAKARELLLTGKLVSAEYFRQLGLVTEIVEAGKIADRVEEFAAQLVKETSPQSIALTRKMIAEIQTLPTENALNYAAEQNAHARAQDDCKRGIGAFLNKEEITWS
ncbi:MAG: enoyl-CoA hydratase/isomerase family protein [Bacteroidia bacterium]